MEGRERLTWQNEGGAKAATEQPVLPVERAASAHPATPDEGAAHPANQPDPEVHDYENGDTSSWAEDPTTGPYPNSAHPATPDEGAAHPAYKAAAEELYLATEKKAAKCIRVASQLLAGISTEASAIEDQALDLMHLSDAALDSTLDRLATMATASEDDDEDDEGESDEEASKKAAEDEALFRRLLAEEGMDDDEDEEDEGKEASADKSATEQILAALAGITSRLDNLESKKAEVEYMDDDAEVESMLQSMLQEEEVEVDTVACGEPMAEMEMEVEDMDPMMDEPEMGEFFEVDDPMGMLDDEIGMDEDEEMMLSSLFASDKLASDDEDDDDEDGEEAEVDEEASKKASQKPRPKKASQGVTRLGGVQKAAGSDLSDLEKLWASAPDVSQVFK